MYILDHDQKCMVPAPGPWALDRGGETLDHEVEQLRVELSGTTGENIVIRRFARFQVGA